jgi:penicillin-binding protein 2
MMTSDYPTHYYRIRLKLFAGIVCAVLGLLCLRLIQLQILDAEDYSGESASNAVRVHRVVPARGVMFDRNGVLMVDNEPTYTIQFTPRYFDHNRIGLIASLVGVTDSLVAARLEEARSWSAFRPSAAFRHVEFDVLSRVQEHLYLLPGVSYEVTQRRRYVTEARAMHALGYVREISGAELETRADEGYRPGDVVGRTGIERAYEKELRGRLGQELKLVNVMGLEVKSYRDGKDDTPPVSGYDLTLTLDSEVQALAESLFVNKRGAVVALEPGTGEIIALLSKPDFDPGMFTSEVTPEAWRAMNSAESDPMFNRATMSGFPPGSTWKPFMALVALQEGLITPRSTYNCRGAYVLGNRPFRDHAGHVHGVIAVEEAIEQSCNSFFFNLMMHLDVDSFRDWGHRFGFGQRIEMAFGEQNPGLTPDSAYFDRAYPAGWTAGFSINMGIGQGDLLVTPMQLARYAAALANWGTLHPPHFVRTLRQPESGEVRRPELPRSRTIPVDQQHFQVVRNGMRRVMEDGTGQWAQIPGIPSAGKTGTAQAPGDAEDHSVFILFAPFEEPRIALAVMVENGGFGATQAAPIASILAEKYLTGSIARPRRWLLDHVKTLKSEDL